MRPRRRPMLLATAVVLALVALVAVALAGGFDTITTKRVRGSGTRVVRVELVDAILGFDVTPDVIEVNPGTHLVLRLINDGDEIHDLALYGGATRTRLLDPGEVTAARCRHRHRGCRGLCTVSGHKLFGDG